MEDLTDVEPLDYEDFMTLVEIHNARQDGNMDLVAELMEDVDFDLPMGPHGAGNMGGGRGKGGFGSQLNGGTGQRGNCAGGV